MQMDDFDPVGAMSPAPTELDSESDDLDDPYGFHAKAEKEVQMMATPSTTQRLVRVRTSADQVQISAPRLIRDSPPLTRRVLAAPIHHRLDHQLSPEAQLIRSLLRPPPNCAYENFSYTYPGFDWHSMQRCPWFRLVQSMADVTNKTKEIASRRPFKIGATAAPKRRWIDLDLGKDYTTMVATAVGCRDNATSGEAALLSVYGKYRMCQNADGATGGEGLGVASPQFVYVAFR